MSEETKDQIIERLRDRITYLEAASPGAAAIVRERMWQIEEEGWTPEHDDKHQTEELAWAAACYAAPGKIMGYRRAGGIAASLVEEGAYLVFEPWPFSAGWDKRGKHPRLRQLEIAGAFIAAEIDRLKRAKGPMGGN
ncbi:MAG: hypothetical protein AAB368_14140 [bacterium]